MKEKEEKRVREIINNIEENSGLKRLVSMHTINFCDIYNIVTTTFPWFPSLQGDRTVEKEELLDILIRELNFKQDFMDLHREHDDISNEELRYKLEERADKMLKSKLISIEGIRQSVEDTTSKRDAMNQEVN